MLGVVFVLSACTGIFGGIYDNGTVLPQSQLYINASNWKQWTYVSLEGLTDGSNGSNGSNGSSVVTMDIPTDTVKGDSCRDGIYTYLYDVYGEGVSKREFYSYYRTEAQQEPERWSFAVHRNNVRTNGGAVFETNLTSMDQLPDSSDAYKDEVFVADEWNLGDVWVDNSQMLQGLIGNQGIEINPVLSSWLKVDIPPFPPRFTLNNHVFILRLKDGTYAALQLKNYQSTSGTKCCLTINYRYPY